MQRLAFTMQLHPGQAQEYKRRHDALWPDLLQLLKDTGIEDYSIFLDEKTHTLFGVLKVRDAANLVPLPDQPVMRRWWQHMKDIMDTNPDGSPVQVSLTEVFHLD
ncbi:L-rhamnose mutarotase [Chryseolinea lacunae]|uniref:L-rhamnose mutarotase n=1 Tax=Chryseolinea lacunae TaxID=2801331 RepID=A0ABS1KVS6_9BACT|nr:L-rhamnose mutarotase [Chryseolinea lacunae]MBL0743450.1 L-rhamnose mutarotase [Chryseolinea lacunae]